MAFIIILNGCNVFMRATFYPKRGATRRRVTKPSQEPLTDKKATLVEKLVNRVKRRFRRTNLDVLVLPKSKPRLLRESAYDFYAGGKHGDIFTLLTIDSRHNTLCIKKSTSSRPIFKNHRFVM